MTMNTYEKYIALSRYARYLDKEERRETWDETVGRYVDYFKSKNPTLRLPWKELEGAIRDRQVMPSMRCLMTAGPALDRDNVAGYNCSYLPIDNPRAFDETMYTLMCGTGVGFSVERQYVNKLPEIPHEFYNTDTVIRVADSKVGWARATRELFAMLYAGQIPRWDLSAIRPAGSRLVTFGGRASGPEPLEDFFRFACDTFRRASGRRLNSLECHDLVCKIADIVVCGGVRRSALISLSNLTDERMRHAKQGEWWINNGQRALANNSVAYTELPDMGTFIREWESLYSSKSGERGIFSRVAATKQAAMGGRRDTDFEFGTNPCSEIILRPNQFCNLSECVVRSDDSFGSLKDKVRLATMLGTLQSGLVDFRYLSPKWKKNTEEERLLGVSLTGIMDHPILSVPSDVSGDYLRRLRDETVRVNKQVAKDMDIPESTAITCVKPSGTVSQLVGSASGIHPRYAHSYIRRVRADVKDPLATWMKDKGVPCEVDFYNQNNLVFSFPIRAPEGAITRHEVSATQQLELVSHYNANWCEHKASVTVYVKEEEWLDVGAWVYKHFDSISGVSFLPTDSGSYRQAPYTEVQENEILELESSMPTIDFSEYVEQGDNTTSSQELACVAGVCEL
jgi:ribonucleoside-triphosphate reductase (thioredoxin)